MRKKFVFLFVSLLLFAAPILPAAGGPLVVVGDVFKNKPIPVALKGYNGEVARVLKFDLEVMGCKIVPDKDAAYFLEGANQETVNGILKDVAGNAAGSLSYAPIF